jgi:hypothetical protein
MALSPMGLQQRGNPEDGTAMICGRLKICSSKTASGSASKHSNEDRFPWLLSLFFDGGAA